MTYQDFLKTKELETIQAGIDVKESYWKAGCDNLDMLDMEKQQMSLFDFIGMES